MKEKTFIEQEYERERSMSAPKTFMERVKSKFSPKAKPVYKPSEQKVEELYSFKSGFEKGILTANDIRRQVGHSGIQNICYTIAKNAGESIMLIDECDGHITFA